MKYDHSILNNPREIYKFAEYFQSVSLPSEFENGIGNFNCFFETLYCIISIKNSNHIIYFSFKKIGK